MPVSRVVLLVLDGVGVGAAPDADQYGDAGSDSVGNTSRAVGGLALPHLEALGMGNVTNIQGVAPRPGARGVYGKLRERSAGKDSIAGHWELCGVVTERAQPTYPRGFPPVVIEAFEQAIGRHVLGNRAASGTDIIDELGEQHLRTGFPIVYTSADSVFQVAAHDNAVPVAELYRFCELARGILRGEHEVGRVIARPFVGRTGAFVRTSRRKDWALEPPSVTLLDRVHDAGMDVVGVGKIDDIVGRRSLTRSEHTTNNHESIEATLLLLRQDTHGLVMTNLIEFDQTWGHRNDPEGYAAALVEFDRRLPELLAALRPTDVLAITGDHGCDPTTASTDHSREYVPILIAGTPCRRGVDLGIRSSFADVGQTIAELLGVKPLSAGVSVAREILLPTASP